METHELHRGRLVDHLQLVVRDLAASRTFYEAILAVLEIPMGGTGDNYFWADELFVSTADSAAAHGELTGRHHLAFQARDRAAVDAFYKAAMEHGGRTTAHLGSAISPRLLRRVCPGPDGNNIEAVFHGEAKRSAPLVKVTF